MVASEHALRRPCSLLSVIPQYDMSQKLISCNQKPYQHTDSSVVSPSAIWFVLNERTGHIVPKTTLCLCSQEESPAIPHIGMWHYTN